MPSPTLPAGAPLSRPPANQKRSSDLNLGGITHKLLDLSLKICVMFILSFDAEQLHSSHGYGNCPPFVSRATGFALAVILARYRRHLQRHHAPGAHDLAPAGRAAAAFVVAIFHFERRRNGRERALGWA